MTDPAYPAPHRLTVDDLDPESATTDRLIALVRSHRQGEDYPTPEQLIGNLPIVLRTLYNLYHILNHLNLFGGRYRAQAERMMAQLLAELR